MRGAERTFAEMCACWPEAPIYTLLYDSGGAAAFSGREVHSSYLQRLGVDQRHFRYLLPFFPRAVEHLPVEQYDVIVSSSSAFAHGVRPRPGALHVCYCHSPFRYTWFEQGRALSECPRPARPLLRRTLRRLRFWDLGASERVTHYVANSEITRERIARIYGREADVLHPPVSVERFSPGDSGDHLLFVGQIVRHKRVDVAIEAARSAGRRIKVVGSGPDLDALRERYGGPGVEFLGSVSDADLVGLYAGCAALVVPNVEEFGIAAVEAQASGRPVVALNRGGVRETVLPGETGLLVEGEDAQSLAEAIRGADFDRFDPEAIAAHAQRFSSAEFRRRLRQLVDRYRDLAGTLPAFTGRSTGSPWGSGP
jgi:glycosyltransferase involved in cell wall biosynthesis